MTGRKSEKERHLIARVTEEKPVRWERSKKWGRFPTLASRR